MISYAPIADKTLLAPQLREIVVTFLAILELVREGAARVVQANQFEPILVEQVRHA